MRALEHVRPKDLGHLRVHLRERRARIDLSGRLSNSRRRGLSSAGSHQTAEIDGTVAENWSRAAQLSPPIITNVGPPLVMRTLPRSSFASGKYASASITSRHAATTRRSVIGQSREREDVRRDRRTDEAPRSSARRVASHRQRELRAVAPFLRTSLDRRQRRRSSFQCAAANRE